MQIRLCQCALILFVALAFFPTMVFLQMTILFEVCKRDRGIVNADHDLKIFVKEWMDKRTNWNELREYGIEACGMGRSIYMMFMDQYDVPVCYFNGKVEIRSCLELAAMKNATIDSHLNYVQITTAVLSQVTQMQ